MNSKNSKDNASELRRLETIRKKGFVDGCDDPQPCELAPVNLTKWEEIDSWTLGYRQGLATRKAKA